MEHTYSCGQGTFMNAESLYHFQIAIGEISEQLCFTIFYHKVSDKDACDTDHLMESYLSSEDKPVYFAGIQTFYVTLQPSYKDKLCAHMRILLQDYAHAHPEEAPVAHTLRFKGKQPVSGQSRQAELYTMGTCGVITEGEHETKARESVPTLSADEFIHMLEWCIDLELINPLSLLDMLDRCHVPYTYATDLDDIIEFRPHTES